METRFLLGKTLLKGFTCREVLVLWGWSVCISLTASAEVSIPCLLRCLRDWLLGFCTYASRWFLFLVSEYCFSMCHRTASCSSLLLPGRLCPCLADKKSQRWGWAAVGNNITLVISPILCLQNQCNFFQMVNIVCGIPMMSTVAFSSAPQQS